MLFDFSSAHAVDKLKNSKLSVSSGKQTKQIKTNKTVKNAILSKMPAKQNI